MKNRFNHFSVPPKKKLKFGGGGDSGPTRAVKSIAGDVVHSVAGNHFIGFDVDDQNPITLSASLPSPRMFLANSARKFALEEIVEPHKEKGSHEMPVKFQICLTNSQDEADQKYISVKYFVNFNAGVENVKIGVEPVQIYVAFRKGSNVRDNKTILALPFDAFQRLLVHGREMVEKMTALDGKTFGSIKNVVLPHDVVLKETTSGDKTNLSKSVILLAPTMFPSKRDGCNAAVAINIREFVCKGDLYVATQRGICIGLRAMYMLTFPVAQIIRQWHDGFLSLCLLDDTIARVAVAGVEELEPYANLKQWVPDDPNGEEQQDDHLAKDERFVRDLESGAGKPSDNANGNDNDDDCVTDLPIEEFSDDDFQ